MTNQEKAEALEQLMGTLSPADQGFAQSLLTQLKSKGTLSDKQWYWVGKLHAQVMGTAPEKKVIHVGDFSGVVALFQKAKQNLKYPKIILATPAGLPLTLTVAGQGSKAPGTVNVTDGKPYGQNVWYGRVTPEGRWEPGNQVDEQSQVSIATLLTMLAKSPARVAAEYGKLTGVCCFCNTKLTDKRSTEVGYGPVCAKNYGLKWGDQGQAGLFNKIAKEAA